MVKIDFWDVEVHMFRNEKGTKASGEGMKEKKGQ